MPTINGGHSAINGAHVMLNHSIIDLSDYMKRLKKCTIIIE